MFRKLEQKDKMLFLELSEEFYASGAVLAPVSRNFHEAAFNELMSENSLQQCFMLMSDASVAGYALLAKKYSREAGGIELWLEELFVRPEYRCCGLGREFLNYLISRGDYMRLRLETEPDNLRAQALYKSLGFKALGYEQYVLTN